MSGEEEKTKVPEGGVLENGREKRRKREKSKPQRDIVNLPFEYTAKKQRSQEATDLLHLCRKRTGLMTQHRGGSLEKRRREERTGKESQLLKSP